MRKINKKASCSSGKFGFGYKATSRLLLLLLFSVMVLFLASVSSVWAVPTINGVIDTGEWDAYYLGTSTTGWGGGTSVDVYGYSDGTYLYAAYVADMGQLGWSVGVGLGVTNNLGYSTPSTVSWPESGYTLLAAGGSPDYVSQTDDSDLAGQGSFAANGVTIYSGDGLYNTVPNPNVAEVKIPLSLLQYAGSDGQIELGGKYWQYDSATPFTVSENVPVVEGPEIPVACTEQTNLLLGKTTTVWSDEYGDEVDTNPTQYGAGESTDGDDETYWNSDWSRDGYEPKEGYGGSSFLYVDLGGMQAIDQFYISMHADPAEAIDIYATTDSEAPIGSLTGWTLVGSTSGNGAHVVDLDPLIVVSRVKLVFPLEGNDGDARIHEFQARACVGAPTEVYVDGDYNETRCTNAGHIWQYDCFDTIQDGIDAVEGSTVHVAAGTYNENVVITKPIQLIGEGSGVTKIEPSSGRVIDIRAQINNIDGITIQGFTLKTNDNNIALQSNSQVNDGYDGMNYLYKDLIVDVNNNAQTAVGLFDVEGIILDNVIVKNSARTDGGAIEMVGVKDFLMINSEITNNQIGLKIFDVSGYESNNNINITHSKIVGNQIIGIQNLVNGLTLKAENNYWGDASGPTYISNPGGAGDSASGNVDVCPFLNDTYPVGVSTICYNRPCGDGTDICTWNKVLPLGSEWYSGCPNLFSNTDWPVKTITTATCTFDADDLQDTDLFPLYVSINNDIINCTLNGDVVFENQAHEGCAPVDPRDGYQINLTDYDIIEKDNTLICYMEDRGVMTHFDACVIDCPEPGTVRDGLCYYGTRDCKQANGGLSTAEMGSCNDICDPIEGPKDITPPVTSDVLVTPTYNGGIFNLTGTATDTCSPIKTAEYFLGRSNQPRDCGDYGTGTAIYPENDGTFDLNNLVEYLKAEDVIFFNDGGNWACIQSQDNASNWGNCNCANFETDALPPEEPFDIKLNNEYDPYEYLVCGMDPTLTATVCDSQSDIL